MKRSMERFAKDRDPQNGGALKWERDGNLVYCLAPNADGHQVNYLTVRVEEAAAVLGGAENYAIDICAFLNLQQKTGTAP